MSHETDRLNRQLQQHSDELMKLSNEYVELANDGVTKRNVYDMAKARALLTIRTDEAMAKFTVAEKEAMVKTMTETPMINARVSEAMLDACKTRLRAVEASLSAVQSIARLATAESNADKYRT